jgi:hypothetical protein
MLTERRRALVRRYMKYDLPDEMAACFDCDMEPCQYDRYANCARRIAHAADLACNRSEGAYSVTPSVDLAELPEQRLFVFSDHPE